MTGQNSTELDWIKLKRDIGSEDVISSEKGLDKLLRKCQENPLVPFGAALTVGCLLMGLRSFHRGEARQSQMLMRARVLAQAFTITALAGGVLLSSQRLK